MLEGPPLPAALVYLWDWFLELDLSRGEGMMGIPPLTYVMLHAWAQLTRRRPASYEVRALFQLDLAVRHPEAFGGSA